MTIITLAIGQVCEEGSDPHLAQGPVTSRGSILGRAAGMASVGLARRVVCVQVQVARDVRDPPPPPPLTSQGGEPRLMEGSGGPLSQQGAKSPVLRPGVIPANPRVLKEPGSNKRVKNDGYQSFGLTPGQAHVKIWAILSNSMRQVF